MKYKVASLFAGIGGICYGFKQAGAEIVWANEIDKDACKTYRNNFGNEYLIEGDIKKIDANDIPDIDILKQFVIDKNLDIILIWCKEKNHLMPFFISIMIELW